MYIGRPGELDELRREPIFTELLHSAQSYLMHDVFELAGRTLGGAYAIYMALMGLPGVYGVHLIILVILAWLIWRGRFTRAVGLDIIYGFVNPLIYLLVFEPFGVLRERRPIDTWLDALAWTLFVAVWGARLLLPRQLERSPATRAHLSRLCLLALATLVIFAVNDFVRLWVPNMLRASTTSQRAWGVWTLCAFGAMYALPAVLLNQYRLRLLTAAPDSGLLIFGRRPALRIAAAFLTLVIAGIAGSWLRPSHDATRDRIEKLAPVFVSISQRYGVDPRLLAAIVYVTEREQHEPFRDKLERMAMTTFLVDSGSHMHLARRFDLSIGVAQVKPITALTALKLCKDSGQPWELHYKDLRDVPRLGDEWRLGSAALDACQPPAMPIPVDKPHVVAALMRDESNVAFAGLILALYQAQWKAARAEWDISERPDILATLYQIGFAKSKPHGEPRSNDFGRRVAEVSRQAWLQQRFDVPRVARN
jgi:hypothetical protein